MEPFAYLLSAREAFKGRRLFLQQGYHYQHLQIIDYATFKVDRTAPAAPVMGSPPNGFTIRAIPPGNPGAGSSPPILVAGTAEPGSKITVYDGSTP